MGSHGTKGKKERKEDDRQRWKGRGKTTSKKNKALEDSTKEQRRQKRRKYNLLGDQCGEGEELSGEEIVVTTTTTHSMAPTIIAAPPNIEVPSAVRQTSMIEFISVRDHPMIPEGGVATNVIEEGDSIEDELADVIFERLPVDDDGGTTTSIEEDDKGGCSSTIRDTLTDADNTLKSSEDNNLPVTSIGGGDEVQLCKPDDRGCCVRHGSVMTKTKVSSKNGVTGARIEVLVGRQRRY